MDRALSYLTTDAYAADVSNVRTVSYAFLRIESIFMEYIHATNGFH